MSSSTSFPEAQQAQIIRAHQRDVFHIFSLKDQIETVLRSWLGTRWLTRWDKEVELLVKALYYGTTVGRASQTLGEEYTDIWQFSARSRNIPSIIERMALILSYTLPSYMASRCVAVLASRFAMTSTTLRNFREAFEVLAEINLAVFYLHGGYYDLVKRIHGMFYISTLPQNPQTRPPSYSLLGILIGSRLLYRAISFIRHVLKSVQLETPVETALDKQMSRNTFLDKRLVSSFLEPSTGEEPKPAAEEDEHTVLDISIIPSPRRAGRNCTLCLEERTDSCVTECGHLFCWSCIVSWGREKAECPLCRQTLNLTRLIPIYNL